MPWGRSVEEDRRQFLEEFGRPGVNRRAVCRAHGISAKAGYALWNRYCVEGEAGVGARSRRPDRSRARLGAELEGWILAIRDDYRCGPRKIRWHLEDQGCARVPARSTIEAVLRRNARIASRLRRSRALRRFEHAQPNQMWQMDFKGHFLLRNGQRCHPLTILDDHSRYLIELHACADERAETVRERLKLRFRENGLPEVILADNGSPWGS